MKKRKRFDAKSKRIVNDEHKEILNHNQIMEKKNKNKGVADAKKKTGGNWRAQSEMFRNAMKAATNDDGGNTHTNDLIIIDSKQGNNKQGSFSNNDLVVGKGIKSIYIFK